MIEYKARTALRLLAVSAVVFAGFVAAEDWASKTFKIEGGGILYLEYPLSWGKKPEHESFDDVTDVKFGPYGPNSKPIFLAQVQAVKGVDVLTNEALKEVAEIDVGKLRASAFESDIPLNEIAGPQARGYYFTITDKEKTYGEFEYLTMAVIGSQELLIKVFFFSSDGAPDFGADALRMMENLRYTPPEEDK